MIINHNMGAINAQRNMNINSGAAAKNMEKLSSGLKINRAGDNAAGLSISEKMRAQIRGLDQASTNSEDGISMIQTAEGALNETHSILQRMRELAVQAGNDTNASTDRNAIQEEINQLTSEINRIGNTTEFNTQKLLNGDKASSGVKTIIQGASSVTAASSSAFIGGFTLTDSSANGAALNGIEIEYKYDSTQTTSTATFNSTTGKLTITANTTVAAAATKIQTDMRAITGNKFHDVTVSLGTGTAQTTSSTHNVEFAGGVDKKDAVKGEYSFDLAKGNVTIDGYTYTYNADKTLAENAQDFKTGYAGSAATNYNVTVAGNNITFTEITAGHGAAVVTGDGVTDTSVKLQIGANENQSMSISIEDMRAAALGLTTTGPKDGFSQKANVTDGTNSTNVEYSLDVTSYDTAKSAITTIEAALEKVSAQRSSLGAYQNRLEHTINNLDNSSENLTSAESRIRDTDMAKEMSEYSKNNILQQASQAMLAQAKSQPENVLQLLR